MRKIWLDRTMISLPVYLGLCKAESSFKSILRRFKIREKIPWIPDDADASTHAFEKSGITMCVVCIRSKKKTFDVWNLLGHEAVHVYQSAKPLLPSGLLNDELEAILIQEICLKLWTAFKDNS